MHNPYRRSVLLITLAVLIAGWLGAYAFTLWRLRDAALSGGLEAATTQARNFEQHLTQTLEMIELIALGLAPGQSTESVGERFGAQMNDALRKAPYLRSLSLADAEGRILYSTTPGNVGSRLALRGFFPDLAADSTMIHIGQRWQGRDLAGAGAFTPLAATKGAASRQPAFIPVLRRIGDNGQPYWVVAAINPEYFVLHFTQLLPETEGRVQLLRHDGTLLLSSRLDELPGHSQAAGRVEDLLAQHESGALAQTLPDGAAVLTAYRASSRFPALIAVHLQRETILENWRSEARRISLVVFPVLFALTVSIVLVWRRQQRLDQRERELAGQRKLAASVFEATTNAVFLTTPGGDVITVNPAFERITGYRADEVVGRNPRLLASGVHDRAFYADLWHGIQENGHWHGEIVNRRKDGSLFHGQLSITAVTDDAGRLLHYVGVTADITERKQYEAEILAAKEKAEAASLAKTTFLATMSHELRTPMNGVIGMTDVLLRSAIDDKQRRQLEIIRASAGALMSILDQILDYSKIETQTLQLADAPFDPAALVGELATLFTPPATAKGLRLRSCLAPDLPACLHADPVRLRQILTNLLSNAVKFTRDGEIVVDASFAAPDRLCIAVSDTGIGIAPEMQQQIFAAFTQVDGSTTREFGGTGLGLASSRRLAEAMGGSLEVASTPGQGSRFTLCVAARRD
ncbi:ATP-binding protein [Azonexus fungiphilus]|uniref:ATP-binding protein n=1 Tax=Azonexus fungiphilus TaxID=146940 RepID=UPI00156AFAA3|nr:ATP-binding protein [Azonexus fungiphilus]NHC05296.1 PAS domain S-box protein [Azonexus fungiphilus]